MGRRAVVAVLACARLAELLPLANEVHELSASSSLEGWMVGGKGESCTTACSAASLECTTANLAAHNNEIDTDDDMNNVLTNLNQTGCYWKEHAYNTNGNVPSFSPGLSQDWFGEGKTWCAISDPSRPIESFNCDDEAAGDAQRLCYCAPPSAPSSQGANQVMAKSQVHKRAPKDAFMNHKVARKSAGASAAEGWVVGDAGDDCTTTCTSRGLACSDAKQNEHNFEVDSDTEMDHLLQQIGEPPCFWHSHTYGVNGNVASFAPHVGSDFFGQNETWCAISEPGRPDTSYSCAERAPSDARRLCYCAM